jgi:hypothetical protein
MQLEFIEDVCSISTFKHCPPASQLSRFSDHPAHRVTRSQDPLHMTTLTIEEKLPFFRKIKDSNAVLINLHLNQSDDPVTLLGQRMLVGS